MIFSCEDIHDLRLKMAERYSRMTEEEAERDFKERVAEEWRAVEEARRMKEKAAV